MKKQAGADTKQIDADLKAALKDKTGVKAT
jgi:hypothetical protein